MLTLENIYRHVGKVQIVKGVDLQIQPGQAIGLVGPNGCGKTSLLNIINGFTPSANGSLTLNGRDISSLGVEQRAKLGVGRVFQSFGVFKQLTLYENLATAYVSKLHRTRKFLPLSFLPQQYKDEIDAILRELDLYEKRHELAGNLSGGQMRLLEIGRLYLQDTKLYLLDEPTAGVSPKLKGKVIELLNKIISKGKMVIIVEHDFDFLAQFVDKIFVMNDGKIVLEGTHEEVKYSPAIKEIYFGRDKVAKSDGILERAELVKRDK